MICRSCNNLYFRKNKQKICLNCYTNGERRERLFYTVKEWKGFSFEIQEELGSIYEVILVNHKTWKEKIRSILTRAPPQVRAARKAKLSKGFNKFKKIMDQFSNGMSQLHFEGGSDASMNKITGGLNKASGVDHNFDVLTGGSNRQIKKVKTKWKYVKVRKESRRKTKDSDPYSIMGNGNDRDFSL